MSVLAHSAAIIDCGLGNLFSVEQACRTVGLTAITTSDPDLVAEAGGVILPGVGAFADAMAALRAGGLVDALECSLTAGKPFMGICLGMQLLFDRSLEFGEHAGLGFLPGSVERLPGEFGGIRRKVPQVGWYPVAPPSAGDIGRWMSTPLRGLQPGAYLHFVHSYYVRPEDPDDILAITDSGGFAFCSAVARGNIFASQFHPERSGILGLRIYDHFRQAVAAC
jgi:imidazole glycerol-phosphate synthase subunit HisH